MFKKLFLSTIFIAGNAFAAENEPTKDEAEAFINNPKLIFNNSAFSTWTFNQNSHKTAIEQFTEKLNTLTSADSNKVTLRIYFLGKTDSGDNKIRDRDMTLLGCGKNVITGNYPSRYEITPEVSLQLHQELLRSSLLVAAVYRQLKITTPGDQCSLDL